MPSRRIEQVDAITGEVIQGSVLVLATPKRQNGFQHGGWAAMALDGLGLIANNQRLGRDALRVYMKLCSKLDFENWINIQQAELAKQMDMQPSNFSRAVALLVEDGIILKGPNVGTRKTYRLNPAYGWKGSAGNHKKALQEQTTAAHLSLVSDRT